ncbi:MAG: permease [Candidatus Marinimicrobia bacterium]|nr:permease [Candidatus Neomarinimicrobiota bacterium]
MVKNTIKAGQTKEGRKTLIGLGFITLLFLIVMKVSPEKSPAIIDVSLSYFKEMIIIFPAIVLLMGLFMVWISKDIVLKYMGAASGLKGIIISIILGALPTGPLYAAFPLALAMKNKGASITNIVVFLSAWACIKIPQELVEFQFLGLKFMLLRLTLTTIFVIIMGMVIEKLTKVIE